MGVVKLDPCGGKPSSEENLKADGNYHAAVDCTFQIPLVVFLLHCRDSLRSYLAIQVDWSVGLMARIQAYRNPLLDMYFKYATVCGTEDFYFAIVPIFVWFGNARLYRSLILLMAMDIYSCNLLKNIFGLARPPHDLRLKGVHFQPCCPNPYDKCWF